MILDGMLRAYKSLSQHGLRLVNNESFDITVLIHYDCRMFVNTLVYRIGVGRGWVVGR